MIRRSSVDLPQPLAPTMLTNSPGVIESEMSCNTGRAAPLTSYCLLTFCSVRVPACAMVNRSGNERTKGVVLHVASGLFVLGHRAPAPGQQAVLELAGQPVQGKAHQADHDDAEQHQVHLEVLATIDQGVADALARHQQVLG